MPFIVTGIILLGITFYILIKKKISGIFEKKSNIWIIVFIIYCSIISLLNKNFIGFGCALFFLAIIINAKFIREYITADIFEDGLNITCIMGLLTALFCIIDFAYIKFIIANIGTYRSTLYFFNSNYLATLFATVIIVCAYKVLNHKCKAIYYYIVAVFCALGAYLTGSMFVWVEVFIGCAALLVLNGRHQLLSALFLFAGTCVIVLYCVPILLPRINESNITTDNRVTIWTTTITAIKDSSPIFGKGFLTYFHIKDLYPKSYNTAHSHSIFLEPFLSFGILGTIPLVVYFSYFYKNVILCKKAQHKYGISTLILAISLAAAVHGTTDLTFIWIQTTLFYSLIFASVGIEEKLLKIN